MPEEPMHLAAVEPADPDSSALLDAESAVLGSLINDEKSWDKIGNLTVADFSQFEHRMIFEALEALERQGKPIDLVTLSYELRKHEEYQNHPSILSHTHHIANENYASDRVEHYVSIVLDYSVQRRLRRACRNIEGLIGDPEGRDAQAILNEAERLILEISDTDRHNRSDFVRIQDAARESVGHIEDRHEWVRNNPNKTMVLGTPTGFSEFDSRTSGLQRGELVILAGSPGMGKTSLAMNIAYNVAMGGIPGHEQDVVAIFSMEMSARQLADRLLALVSRVDQKKLHTGQLEDADWRKIEGAVDELKRPNLYVHDISSAPPSFIRRMARRLRAAHRNRLDLIVIDYLQLMPSDGTRHDNRNAELASITRELKAIANELQTPVLCLSQLNREGSKRDAGDAPKLQELRDSGAIEQDADIVMFLYEAQEGNDQPRDDTAVAELKVAKNRNGPCFAMKLVFTKPITRFLPHIPDDYQGETPSFEGKGL